MAKGFKASAFLGDRSTSSFGSEVFISNTGGSSVSQKYVSFSPARYSSSIRSIMESLPIV
jgi:hypothetical protein